MRKFYSAIMALTVLLFASCDKDENGAQTDIGTDTKMSLVISFPETRATDANATANEVKVKSVNVFIFNADGTPAKGNLSVDFDDFTKDLDNNTYTLPPANRITTTSGAKRIYVGFNLPGDLTNDKTATESEVLLAAQKTEDNPFALAPARKENEFLIDEDDYIAMLSQRKDVVLTAIVNEEDDDEVTPAENKIKVLVERLVAKIAVSTGDDLSFNVGDVTHYYKLEPDMFTVGNLAPKYYPAQQKNALGKLLTPLMIDGSGNTTHTPHLLPQKGLNAKGDAIKGLNAYYVPEHATSSLNLQGEATYAVVRAKLTFSHFYKVEDDGTGTGTDIIVAEGNEGTYTDKLYVLTNGVTSYFCKTPQDRLDVISVLDDTSFGTLEFEYSTVSGSEGYFAFYYVFINRDETSDPLAIYRNTYINMTINGVNGLGYPGLPGTPTEPPVGPPDPPTPIFQDAYLEIIADVAEWSYKSQGIVLE